MLTRSPSHSICLDHLAPEHLMENMLSALFGREYFVVADNLVRLYSPSHDWLFFHSKFRDDFAISFDGLVSQKVHNEYQRMLLCSLLGEGAVGELLDALSIDIVEPPEKEFETERRFLIYGQGPGGTEDAFDLVVKGSMCFAGSLAQQALLRGHDRSFTRRVKRWIMKREGEM